MVNFLHKIFAKKYIFDDNSILSDPSHSSGTSTHLTPWISKLHNEGKNGAKYLGSGAFSLLWPPCSEEPLQLINQKFFPRKKFLEKWKEIFQRQMGKKSAKTHMSGTNRQGWLCYVTYHLQRQDAAKGEAEST